MAKYPSPGAVKSRLAVAIGEAAACRLARAFVSDLAARLATLDYAVTWAVWPPGAPLAALVAGQRCIAQRGRDLGERLAAALGDCLADAPAPVIGLGTDAPHVELACIAEAAGVLAAGADAVLGPALDGGYYLIGMRAPQPALFRDIAWGGPTVLAETLARAHAAGLRTHLLAPTFDVDDAAGLAALQRLLDAGEVSLPHTAAALAAMACPDPQG